MSAAPQAVSTKPKERRAGRETASRRPEAGVRQEPPAVALTLQRTVGNRAVTRLVKEDAQAQPRGRSPLTVRRSDALGAGRAKTNPLLIQRSPASELISAHTSILGNLREHELGLALLQHARQGNHAVVQAVFDELGATDRDDVAVEMINAATDEVIDGIAQSEEGRRLLDRVYDELTRGSVGDDETLAADRVMKAKSRLIDVQQFAPENLSTAKVFPYRLPGLTVLNDAPISAERRGKGKIWVKQPVRVLGTADFRAETRTLPVQVFTSGLELPESEIIGVRMYDLGGEVHYRPALYLVQLANETTTTIYQKIGEAAGFGLSLGSGALVGLGVRAGMAARVLLWADRAATVIGAATSILREHRGWIIRRFGDSGKTFLHYMDIVNSAAMLYGFARVAIGVGQLINGLRTARKNWRNSMRAVESELSADERKVVAQLDSQTDEVLDSAEQIRSGKEAKAGQPPAAEQTPSGSASESRPLPKAPDEGVGAAKDASTGPAITGGAKPPAGAFKIDAGKQGKHIVGHPNYIPGRSILTANPDELARSAGSGTPVGNVLRGQPGFKERIDFELSIGLYVDPVTGAQSPTSIGIIHYAKTGIHIVPARP